MKKTITGGHSQKQTNPKEDATPGCDDQCCSFSVKDRFEYLNTGQVDEEQGQNGELGIFLKTGKFISTYVLAFVVSQSRQLITVLDLIRSVVEFVGYVQQFN